MQDSIRNQINNESVCDTLAKASAALVVWELSLHNVCLNSNLFEFKSGDSVLLVIFKTIFVEWASCFSDLLLLTQQITMPESRLQKLRKESERYSTDIKEKETDNNVFRKQIREIKATIHQTQRDYHATAKGTSKAENQRIKMQKLLKRQKLANEVNAQEKEIAELRLELKRLSKKTFPQFDDTL